MTCGTEPAGPKRLFADAGAITGRHPTDRFPGHAAWLDGSWKLHRVEDRKFAVVRWELYDPAADPTESRDVLAAGPGRADGEGADRQLGSVVRGLND